MTHRLPLLTLAALGLAATAGATAPEPVSLYATPADLAAGTPTDTIVADVDAARRNHGYLGSVGSVDVVRLDLRLKEARALGEVFAFEVGGRLYARSEPARPDRQREFVPVVEYGGDDGLLLERRCHWVAAGSSPGIVVGHAHCALTLHVVDLDTWSVTPVTRRNLSQVIAEDPVLLSSWAAEKKRTPPLMRQYLLRYLERQQLPDDLRLPGPDGAPPAWASTDGPRPTAVVADAR